MMVLPEEDEVALEEMVPQAFDETSNVAGCNAYLLENVSYYTREVLLKYVPEFVAAVEAGASDVMYLPNSSLGCAPELDALLWKRLPSLVELREELASIL